jgi:hypothetical protein
MICNTRINPSAVAQYNQMMSSMTRIHLTLQEKDATSFGYRMPVGTCSLLRSVYSTRFESWNKRIFAFLPQCPSDCHMCVLGMCDPSQVCFFILAPITCNPQCQNNGKCTSTNTCTCTNGFSGPTCEIRKCKVYLIFISDSAYFPFFFLC